jgi:hypothetical protein
VVAIVSITPAFRATRTGIGSLTYTVLFEADDDLNILEYIHEHARELIGGSWIPKPHEKISSAALLMLTDGDGGTRIATRVARKQPLKHMSDEVLKQHLDGGVAKLLIEKYRELGLRQAELEGFEDTSNGVNKGFGYYGEYMNVVLAAHMMRIGAVVDDEFKTYLRELVPKVRSHDVWQTILYSNTSQISSRYGYQMSFCDDGFRDPGKAQFLTALDNCTSGQPRVLGPRYIITVCNPTKLLS